MKTIRKGQKRILRKPASLNEPGTLSSLSSRSKTFGKLGVRVEIGSTAKVSVNEPGYNINFFTETIDLVIGIGKNHVAYLVMDIDAWKALKKGESVHVESLREFKNNFL